jgi:hypothetical protein
MLATKCGLQDVNEPHPLKLQDGNAVIAPSLLAILCLVGVQSMEEIISIAGQEESSSGTINAENEASPLKALRQALHTGSVYDQRR